MGILLLARWPASWYPLLTAGQGTTVTLEELQEMTALLQVADQQRQFNPGQVHGFGGISSVLALWLHKARSCRCQQRAAATPAQLTTPIKDELLERFQAAVRQGGSLPDTLDRHVLATVSWAAALDDNDFDLLFAAASGHVTPDSWLAAFGVLQSEGTDLIDLMKQMDQASEALTAAAAGLSPGLIVMQPA